MGYPTKIATCCYCASKMALRLDEGRHELTCASCGAPLRDLKMMPKPVEKRSAVSHQPAARAFSVSASAVESTKPKKTKPVKKKKRSFKKRAAWLRDLAEDAFDFVEDIFD